MFYDGKLYTGNQTGVTQLSYNRIIFSGSVDFSTVEISSNEAYKVKTIHTFPISEYNLIFGYAYIISPQTDLTQRVSMTLSDLKDDYNNMAIGIAGNESPRGFFIYYFKQKVGVTVARIDNIRPAWDSTMLSGDNIYINIETYDLFNKANIYQYNFDIIHIF